MSKRIQADLALPPTNVDATNREDGATGDSSLEAASEAPTGASRHQIFVQLPSSGGHLQRLAAELHTAHLSTLLPGWRISSDQVPQLAKGLYELGVGLVVDVRSH